MHSNLYFSSGLKRSNNISIPKNSSILPQAGYIIAAPANASSSMTSQKKLQSNISRHNKTNKQRLVLPPSGATTLKRPSTFEVVTTSTKKDQLKTQQTWNLGSSVMLGSNSKQVVLGKLGSLSDITPLQHHPTNITNKQDGTS